MVDTPVFVVVFEHNSYSGENVVEVYKDKASADKRLAEIAKNYSDEDEVETAFHAGDYNEVIDLFAKECDSGAGHQFRIIETQIK